MGQYPARQCSAAAAFPGGKHRAGVGTTVTQAAPVAVAEQLSPSPDQTLCACDIYSRFSHAWICQAGRWTAICSEIGLGARGCLFGSTGSPGRCCVGSCIERCRVGKAGTPFSLLQGFGVRLRPRWVQSSSSLPPSPVAP